MQITIQYDRGGDDYNTEDFELHNEELQTFLTCNGIAYNGSYYSIKSKIFEFLDNEFALTVIAKQDISVTF